MDLRSRINEDMKSAMRAQDKKRLATIRLLQAALKQQEVDNRITLDNDGITLTIEKMIKQRRESIRQFEAGNRPDLVEVEVAEIEVLQAYMPIALTDAELGALIVAAVAEAGATSIKDMGKVMNVLKPQILGRADMGEVSGLLKASLAS